MASLLSQLVTETKAQIYARGLAVATALSIDTTSWSPGDPTRSTYWYLAEVLSTLEIIVAEYVRAGFLDYARGVWLTLLADQTFGVQRIEATFAATPVVLTNTGGGLYTIAAGDVTVKNSATGKTYTNTSGGTLSPVGFGSPLPLDFVADEAGAASTSGAGAINALVTGMLGVTCSNAAAAVGLDEELDEPLRARCRDKLGMLSPNGPHGVYDYVARTEALTGSGEITRSRTISDSTTGSVTVYVANAGGAVSGGAITAAQAAVERYATPLCITPTVVNCTSTTVAITYELWLYTSVGETAPAIEAAVLAALTAMFAARPIGGDIIAPATTGALYQSLIASTIRGVYPDHAFRVAVTLPAGDTALAINAVPVLFGTPAATIHLEAAP